MIIATRICTKCGETKSLDRFSLCRTVKKDGRRSACKKCINTKREVNKDEENRKAREYRTTHPEVREYMRGYRDRNWARLKEIKKIHSSKPENRAKAAIDARSRRAENGNYRKWRDANRDKINARSRAYIAEKRRTDEGFKIADNMRTRIRCALKGNVKSAGTEKLLGCTFQEARNHLASLFTGDMTWDAFMRSEIHVDHKVPCCAFDLTRPSEQAKCFHYTNLQPLWGKDNFEKGGTERSATAFAKRCANLEVFDLEVKYAF